MQKNMKAKTLPLTILLGISLILSIFAGLRFFSVAGATGYTETIGTLSGGNNFAVRFPDQWNGMLIVVCRGSTTNPVLDARTSFFNTTATNLMPQGFAVAASSYGPENTPQSGISTTYQLTKYLIDTYHVSGKIFLVGASMGGSVALLLAEKYPTTYSGVLDLDGPKDYKVHYDYKVLIAGMSIPEIRSYVLANCSAAPTQVNDVAMQALKDYCNSSAASMVMQIGGTPQTKPKEYEDISPAYHANITVPVITVHGSGDMICPFSQSTLYQAAVASAGRSSLYRLYAVPPDPKGLVLGHVDSNVMAEIPSRFSELVSWSNALDAWTPTVTDRSLKAYPDLKETVWQTNATMPPNGQYDKIGLHRLVKTGIATKGAVFLLPGIYGSGEQLISNPSQSNYSIDESSNQAVYWANRGFDVYSIDYRAHFLPSTMNSSQASLIMSNWGWDVYISDMKEAVEKTKAVSGFTKIFMAGMSYGETVAMYYASEYWNQDLKGLILLDGSGDTVKFTPTTNTGNATSSLIGRNATNSLALEYPNTPAPSTYPSGILFAYKNAVQNPGAPAEWPPGTPLQPTINPLTNKTWTNITEWFAYKWYSSNYCNVYGGYGNLTVNIQTSAGADRYFPFRLFIETSVIHNWTNCPFVAYDFDDHFQEINVPVLGFRSALFGIPTYGNYTNGLATSDFTQITLPNYMHLDVFTGTYSARDVSEPTYQWMIKRTLTPNLPVVNVTLTVVNGTSSYYNSTLTNVPFGYSIQNGNYVGWCVDKSTVMVRNVAHNVTLYSSSISNTLPISINSFNWNAVNYILNHKQGSMQEIQDAIWYFVPDQQPPPTNESDAIAMINAALANPNYTPTSGNILAIIAYSGSPDGVQNTIIEYRIP